MKYRYRVIYPDGTAVWEVAEAASSLELINRITASGLRVVDVRPVTRLSLLLEARPRIPVGPRRSDVARAYRTLPVLLDAGLPLTRALDGLVHEVASPALARVLTSVRADVEAGHPLHRAMERHETVFGRFAIQTVRAAERGGRLSEALRTIADYEERILAMRARITRALVYPSIVLAAAVLEMAVVSLVLLPRLTELISAAGVRAPAVATFLAAASRTVLRTVPFVPPVLAAALPLLRRWARTPAGRWAVDGLLWRMPVVGEVVRRIAVARMCLAAGTLLRSGVGIREALALAGPASGSVVVETAAARIEQRITGGMRLSEAVRAEEAVFPPLLATMIAVGEQSGALDAMLAHMAEISENEAWPLVDQAVGLVEPFVIVLVGVMVAFIAFAVWGTLTQMLEVIR